MINFKGKLICHNCGTVSNGKRQAKGSLLAELVLWILGVAITPFTLFLSIAIPVFYSAWRLTNKYYSCPECAADNIVETSTPKGKKLIAEYYAS